MGDHRKQRGNIIRGTPKQKIHKFAMEKENMSVRETEANETRTLVEKNGKTRTSKE